MKIYKSNFSLPIHYIKWVVYLVFLVPIITIGQVSELHKNWENQIDPIFSKWNSLERPGVAALILYKGEVIYKKAFGGANLEHQIKMSTDTKLQVGAVAKQITAFAIFQLVEQGKLSLEDDVRTYIPEIPDFGKTIRLRHLISHTSGLHDMDALKAVAGTQEEEIFTIHDVLRLIKKQPELDHEVGTYNANRKINLILLAEVIARVSGNSFAKYTKENIFDPLQMYNTSFIDDPTNLIKNKADGYRQIDGIYKKRNIGSAVPGASNFYTTLDDLSLWIINLRSQKFGSKNIFKRLLTVASFDNGQPIDIEVTRPTLGQRMKYTYNGLPVIYQISNDGGHTSSFYSYPDADFSAIMVTNNSEAYNGNLTRNTRQIILKNYFEQNGNGELEKLKSKKLSNINLEKFVGDYWVDDYSRLIKIYLRNDTLRSSRITGSNERILLPISKNRLQMQTAYKVIMDFKFEENEKQMTATMNGNTRPAHLSKAHETKNYTEQELKQFTGNYYSQQLETSYLLEVKKGKLVAVHPRIGEVDFIPLKEDMFVSKKANFNGIKFERAKNKSIVGLKISNPGAKNICFDKVK